MRDDAELARVAASPALDAVAMRYLDDLIAARCVCPAAGESPIADDLLDDVATALDEDTSLLDAGLVTGYDKSPTGAVAKVIHDPANASAVLGMRMEAAGVATGVIELGDGWLAPPPGGSGPEIDLGGFTLVVIILAGTTP